MHRDLEKGTSLLLGLDEDFVLIHMILLLLERDHIDFMEYGWIPHEFEVEAAGKISCKEIRFSPSGLNIRGRFDRIDTVCNRSRVRIVDYKVSMRRTFQQLMN